MLAGAPLHPSTSTWRWETWLVRGPGRRAWKISLLFFINFPTFCPQLQFDGIYGTRNTGAWCGHCWGFMRKPTTCRNAKYNLSLSHLACLALLVYWDQPLHAALNCNWIWYRPTKNPHFIIPSISFSSQCNDYCRVEILIIIVSFVILIKPLPFCCTENAPR